MLKSSLAVICEAIKMNIEKQLIKKPYKKLGLSIGKKKTGGRNNQGRITAFHRGGGNKIRYIYINQTTQNNILEKKESLPVYASGEVRYLVRDPNRTAWIAGVYWSAKDPNFIGQNLWYSYYSNMLAPEGLTIGSFITNNTCASNKNLQNKKKLGNAEEVISLLTQTIGNTAYLKNLMIGTIIYNIEGKYLRAAGCSGIIISKVQDSVTVKLQSGQYKIFSGNTIASIGVLSNGEHKTREYRKAGQKRWLGRRPIVRGVAMNPIDHPHGGGEGKSSGGRPSVTPWGKPTKGKPTRSSKKPKLISKRD